MGVFESSGVVGGAGAGQYAYLSDFGLSALPYSSRASQGKGNYDFLAVPFATLDEFPAYDNSLYINKKMKTDPAVALDSLKAVREVLAEQEDWSDAALHDKLMENPATLDKKNGQVLFPVRLATTGVQVTPGGAIEIASILGKEETLRRLDLSIKQLEA
jgi:glutamyl/glutaminyl-tRNA synthetase